MTEFIIPLRVSSILGPSLSSVYPCGSRYYNQNRPDSDWDFVGQYSPELENELKDNGFSVILDTEYLSKNRPYNNSLIILQKEDVQVNLVKKLHTYLKIRDLLHKNPIFRSYHYSSNSKERQKFWDGLTAMFEHSTNS